MYLWEEAIPELDRAIDVQRSQRSDHVVFCRLDCCFSGIHTMVVWLDKLNVGILAAYERLDSLGAFVVEDVEPRLIPRSRRYEYSSWNVFTMLSSFRAASGRSRMAF